MGGQNVRTSFTAKTKESPVSTFMFESIGPQPTFPARTTYFNMRTFCLLLLLSSPALLHAQDAPTPVSPSQIQGQLKPEQIASVLKQLEELEKTILAQRGTSLSSTIQRLRTAAASDAAALSLVAECDEVVNVQRKEGDRKAEEDAERRKELQKRRQQEVDREDVEKNGDATLALRLSLEFLALTLEAQQATDTASLLPKVQAYHQSLLASAPKLRGRAGESLSRQFNAERGGASQIGLVISALQLSPYLEKENWPTVPGNVLQHYESLVLSNTRRYKPEELGTQWDTAINMESAIRKARMFEGEFVLWVQNDLPAIRWQRAQDIVRHGGNPVTGLADMLNLIKTNPAHPSSASWVTELRSLVKPAGEEPHPKP